MTFYISARDLLRKDVCIERVKELDQEHKSMIIDNIFRQIPMEDIIITEEDNKIVQGGVLIKAMLSFMGENFKLSKKIKIEKSIRGKRYKQLTNQQKDKLLDYTFRVIAIKEEEMCYYMIEKK